MKVSTEKLELAMAQKKMLQKDLCEKACIAPRPFIAIRKGKVNPRPATVGKIADALGVSIADIIEGEGD